MMISISNCSHGHSFPFRKSMKLRQLPKYKTRHLELKLPISHCLDLNLNQPCEDILETIGILRILVILLGAIVVTFFKKRKSYFLINKFWNILRQNMISRICFKILQNCWGVKNVNNCPNWVISRYGLIILFFLLFCKVWKL